MPRVTVDEEDARKRRRNDDLVLVALAECGGWSYAVDVADELRETGHPMPMTVVAGCLRRLWRQGFVVKRQPDLGRDLWAWNLAADAEDDE